MRFRRFDAPATRWLLLGGAAAVLFAAAAIADPSSGSTADDAVSELDFPVTFDHVWYRTGQKRGWLGPKLVGDLTITGEAIEISSPKIDFTFPLADLRFVSLGTMRGDPDTEWVVFSVERERTTQLIGLRDGKQLGYGTRTAGIHRTIREAARRAGVAQFDAPEGFEAYVELDHQFALAIPREWLSHHQDVVSVDRIPTWGTVVFSPTIPHIAASGLTDREGARKAIRRGDMVAWVVERAESRKGMTCDGLGEKAIARVREWLATSSMFGGIVDPLVAAEPREMPVDRCTGLRWTGGWSGPGGQGGIEIVVASDDRSVFAIALLAPEKQFASELPRFEQALATLRFAVAN